MPETTVSRRGRSAVASAGQTLATVLALVVLVMSVFFFILSFKRSRLDYGAEGRYFDEQTGVVYSDSAVVAYGLTGAVSLGLAAVLLLAAKLLARWGSVDSKNRTLGGPGGQGLSALSQNGDSDQLTGPNQ